MCGVCVGCVCMCVCVRGVCVYVCVGVCVCMCVCVAWCIWFSMGERKKCVTNVKDVEVGKPIWRVPLYKQLTVFRHVSYEECRH